MFVISLKMSKIKLFAIFACVLIIVIAATSTISKISTTSAKAKSQKSVTLTNNDERVNFITNLGWTISPDPIEIIEIVVPNEFNEVYQHYNDIQKTQGYNLNEFKAKRVKRWSYEIKNYPEYEKNIRINLLIYEDNLIGGDICSTELNGFMHGFVKP